MSAAGLRSRDRPRARPARDTAIGNAASWGRRPICRRKVLEDALAAFGIGRDFGEPDRGFHGLDLAEERADAAEIVASTMLQQPGRFRRHLPLIRVTQIAPLLDVDAHLVDDRGGVVGLRRGGEPETLVEQERRLCRRLALLRFRDRGDEFGAAVRRDDLLRRLPGVVEFPVLPWAFMFIMGWSKNGLDTKTPPGTAVARRPAPGDLGESLWEKCSITDEMHTGARAVSPGLSSAGAMTAAVAASLIVRHWKKEAIWGLLFPG